MGYNTFFANKRRKKDNLTNVYTREVINQYINHLISSETPFTYLILDVDDFKNINDTYGHHFGDVILQEVSKQLTAAIDQKGVIGRYGGDEFIFVFEGLTDYDAQWHVCYDILKSPRPISCENVVENYLVTYTIGAAQYPKDAANINDLFDLADKALYRGKMKGKNCFIIYLEEKHKDILLKSVRQRVYSQSDLSRKLYSILTKSEDLDNNINEALQFISDYLIIDQVSIQMNNKITNKYIQSLSKSQVVNVIDDKYYYEWTNLNHGIFCENKTKDSKHNDNEFYAKLIENDITATVVIQIEAFGKIYGYLRADIIWLNTGRLWQQPAISLLSETAHLISLLLDRKQKA